MHDDTEAPAYADCYSESKPIPKSQLKLLAKAMLLIALDKLRKDGK